MKRVTYINSTVIFYFFHVGNDLGVMGSSPGNRDQSVEVSAEINGSFKFGILGLY